MPIGAIKRPSRGAVPAGPKTNSPVIVGTLCNKHTINRFFVYVISIVRLSIELPDNNDALI